MAYSRGDDKYTKCSGFCHKCGHFVEVPSHGLAAEEIIAAMELHSMERCPMTTKAVVEERSVKRRRLELVGRDERGVVLLHFQCVVVGPHF
uniref:Uncharacterized protein n=1 Tax=Setaria digitata TaxID=48799 RepID=A0A915PD89_9BILA